MTNADWSMAARADRYLIETENDASTSDEREIIAGLLEIARTPPAVPAEEVVKLAAELLALAEKATGRKWAQAGGNPRHVHDAESGQGICDAYISGLSDTPVLDAENNLAFIARCREAVPLLCRALLPPREGQTEDGR